MKYSSGKIYGVKAVLCQNGDCSVDALEYGNAWMVIIGSQLRKIVYYLLLNFMLY